MKRKGGGKKSHLFSWFHPLLLFHELGEKKKEKRGVESRERGRRRILADKLWLLFFYIANREGKGGKKKKKKKRKVNLNWEKKKKGVCSSSFAPLHSILSDVMRKKEGRGKKKNRGKKNGETEDKERKKRGKPFGRSRRRLGHTFTVSSPARH